MKKKWERELNRNERRQINQVISSNERLIFSRLRSWKGYFPIFNERLGLDYDALMQECRLAFQRAILTYDPKLGLKLSTHAVACINNRLRQLLNSARRQKHANPVSLDKISSREESLLRKRVKQDKPDQYDLLFHAMDAPLIRKLFRTVPLTREERFVMANRFEALGKSRFPAEIGTEMGRSHEWVRQTEKRALKKIRESAAFKRLLQQLEGK